VGMKQKKMGISDTTFWGERRGREETSKKLEKAVNKVGEGPNKVKTKWNGLPPGHGEGL